MELGLKLVSTPEGRRCHDPSSYFPMAAALTHRRIAGCLVFAGVGLIAACAGVTWRMRARNREIARALLRIERHVVAEIPLATTDPAMIDLLEGLSRWNVGSPHFNVGRGYAQVEYFNRLGPLEWTRSDRLQEPSTFAPVWELHQSYTLTQPRWAWLGAQTVSTRLLTLTNSEPEPAPAAGPHP